MKVESLGEENIQGGQASKASKKDDRGEDAESYVDKDDDSNQEMSQELIFKHTPWQDDDERAGPVKEKKNKKKHKKSDKKGKMKKKMPYFYQK